MHIGSARRVALVAMTTGALTLAIPGSPAQASSELLPMPGAYSCSSMTTASGQQWALRPMTVTSSATVVSAQALVSADPASNPTAVDIRSNSSVGTSSWPLLGTLTQSGSASSGSRFLASYTGSVSLTPGTYWITVREVNSSGTSQSVCNTMSPSPQSPWSIDAARSPNYYVTSNNGASYTGAAIPDVPFVSLSSGSSSAGTGADQSPPSALQEFGRPRAGTCDAAQPDGLNWAGVPSGGWANSWSWWINDGTGGPVCSRMLVYSNAQAKWVLG
jgi:hypothetical protein